MTVAELSGGRGREIRNFQERLVTTVDDSCQSIYGEKSMLEDVIFLLNATAL